MTVNQGRNLLKSERCTQSRLTILSSPRRLRAKYTPRTNLAICTLVISPLQGAMYHSFGQCTPFRNDTDRKLHAVFFAVRLTITLPKQQQPISNGCKTSTPVTGGRSTMARHSFIQMSKLPNVKGRISYITSHARQEIFMPPTVPLTMNFGVTLQGKASRNLSEAERRESVSKQGN